MNKQRQQQIAELEAQLADYYDLETLEPKIFDKYPELVAQLEELRDADDEDDSITTY